MGQRYAFGMTLIKVLAAATATLTALTLTACTGDSDDDGSPDGKFGTVAEVRDALDGTAYQCEWWDEYSDKSASCKVLLSRTETSQHVSRNRIDFTDNPEMMAATNMDSDLANVGSVIGENWSFDCGSDLSAAQCGEVSDILGGEYVERGHWS